MRLAENDNVLTFDSASDQCTGGVPTWGIAYCTEKIVNCYNCLKNKDDPIIHNLPIVGAHTVITPPDRNPFIGLFHQMAHNKCPNQNKSLALPLQLMEHSA